MKEINFSLINNPLKNIILFLNALVVIIVLTNTRGNITTIHALIVALSIANSFFVMKPISEKETWFSYTFNTTFILFLTDINRWLKLSYDLILLITILFFLVSIINILYIYFRSKNTLIIIGKKRPKHRFLFIAIVIFFIAIICSWFIDLQESNFKNKISPEVETIFSEVTQERNKKVAAIKEKQKKLTQEKLNRTSFYGHLGAKGLFDDKLNDDPEGLGTYSNQGKSLEEKVPYSVSTQRLIRSIETLTGEKFRVKNSALSSDYSANYKTYDSLNPEYIKYSIREGILKGYREMMMWKTSAINYLFLASLFAGSLFLFENFISIIPNKINP
ncbi:hypothetical protein [Succinispira mobilis]|uniref:hypothetical protein n=1 Tax=Succinispira mobilis TaxID=78120 RepID=UPI0003743A71|nr:hypothetical protein [Succinispira mobilis]